jgi:hypothetical protein
MSDAKHSPLAVVPRIGVVIGGAEVFQCMDDGVLAITPKTFFCSSRVSISTLPNEHKCEAGNMSSRAAMELKTEPPAEDCLSSLAV